jgi:nitrous oxide reductase accessory protein NosL
MNESPPLSRRRFLWLAAGAGGAALGVGASIWIRRDPLQQRPYPPATVGEHDRCPVCGMYPARFPRWQAQLVLQSGERLSFDSLIEVFRYQAKHPTLNIADLYVSNYGDPSDPRRDHPHAWLPASEAFFVIGTALKGPMNDTGLPAFATAEAAQKLMQHAGGKIIHLTEFTAEFKQQITLRQH